MNDKYKDFKIMQEVRNYKEMCRILDEEITTGNAKKAQLKEWHRYFDYDKVGQKFLILSIYDKPLDKLDKRREGNNALYVKSIELILTDLLSKREGYECKLTKMRLYESLSMTNSDYGKYKNKVGYKAIESWSPDLTPFEVKHFYRETDHVFDKILFSALKSMENRRLIEWEKQYNIVEVSEKGIEVHRVATSDEVYMIIDVENRALNCLGLTKRSQVFRRFLSEKYYDLINEELYDSYGWKYVYVDYHIIYTQKRMEAAGQIIKSEMKEIKQRYEINDERLKLNNKLFDSYDKHTTKQFYDNHEQHKEYENNIMRSGFGNDIAEKEPFRYRDNHLEIQDYLSRCLIKVNP